MSFVGRGTLPQNFLDSSVSPMLRLPTPEPQYLFAQMLLGSRIASNALSMSMTPTEWARAMIGGGGVTLSPDLDRMIRVAETFPSIVQVREEFGKGKGDTIKLERDVFTGAGYTTADRKKTPGKPTSTTGITIQGEEVPMVLEWYRGPFGTNGTEPQPYPVNEFDAQYRNARENLASKITRHLKRDRVKWLDTVVRDQFRGSANTTYPTGIAGAASFTSGGGYNISLEQMLNARKTISDREWQPFSNGLYLFLVPTAFQTQMVGDVDWGRYTKNHTQQNPIYGFIDKLQDIMIVECTTLKTYTAGDVIPGDGTGTVASGVTVYEGLLIGPGAVGYAVGQDAEARFSDDTDYQAEAKVIWDSKESFALLDNRGVQRVLFQA